MPFDSTPVNAPVREEIVILDKVKRIIRHPELWCKGEYEDYEGRHCLIGALRVADHGSITGISWLNPKMYSVLDRLASFAPKTSGSLANRIIQFNDTASHVAVLSLIDEAKISFEMET